MVDVTRDETFTVGVGGMAGPSTGNGWGPAGGPSYNGSSFSGGNGMNDSDADQRLSMPSDGTA